MSWLIGPVLWLGVMLIAGGPADAVGSYLDQSAYQLRGPLLRPLEPYLPQPGDLMLATDNNLFWIITHNLALTGRPNHSGIVFARPDGSLAILEAGPYDTLHVRALDLLPHLRGYEALGSVWIRRRLVPLTDEESARLTAFAMAQDGKRFALIRLAGQLTPLRSRGPLRTRFLGKPQGDRAAYFCSEVVLEACVAAGLLDPALTRPAATYPRDIFFDRSYNPFINRNLHLAPCWAPPPRWASTP